MLFTFYSYLLMVSISDALPTLETYATKTVGISTIIKSLGIMSLPGTSLSQVVCGVMV